MAATRRLTELTSGTIGRLHLPADPRPVVALSGGADSAALAFLSVHSGREVRALHVDHRLAGSPSLEAAAIEIADLLGIPLDRRRVSFDETPSSEEAAREARYRIFDEYEGPIFTAHTRDDLVETMLMNLIRGTGATGLAGIPSSRPPHIHRPMLAITRDETRELATLAGLPFFDDPMNEDMSLTRNRVRRQLLPSMRDLNPRIDEAMARAAENLRRDDDYLDELASEFETGALTVSVITTIPRVLADRVLRNALVSAGITPTADRIQRMWSVASGESDRQDLASGRSVSRQKALLVIDQVAR